MIAFDNGPADGDYVRYIENMAKDAASRLGAVSTATTGIGFGDTMTQARERQAAARRTTSSPAAAAAVARAHALQAAGNPAVLPALGRAVGLLAAGVLLAVIGLLTDPVRFIVVAAGIAIVIVGFRRTASSAAILRDACQRTGTA